MAQDGGFTLVPLDALLDLKESHCRLMDGSRVDEDDLYFSCSGLAGCRALKWMGVLGGRLRRRAYDNKGIMPV